MESLERGTLTSCFIIDGENLCGCTTPLRKVFNTAFCRMKVKDASHSSSEGFKVTCNRMHQKRKDLSLSSLPNSSDNFDKPVKIWESYIQPYTQRVQNSLDQFLPLNKAKVKFAIPDAPDSDDEDADDDKADKVHDPKTYLFKNLFLTTLANQQRAVLSTSFTTYAFRANNLIFKSTLNFQPKLPVTWQNTFFNPHLRSHGSLLADRREWTFGLHPMPFTIPKKVRSYLTTGNMNLPDNCSLKKPTHVIDRRPAEFSTRKGENCTTEERSSEPATTTLALSAGRASRCYSTESAGIRGLSSSEKSATNDEPYFAEKRALRTDSSPSTHRKSRVRSKPKSENVFTEGSLCETYRHCTAGGVSHKADKALPLGKSPNLGRCSLTGHKNKVDRWSIEDRSPRTEMSSPTTRTQQADRTSSKGTLPTLLKPSGESVECNKSMVQLDAHGSTPALPTGMSADKGKADKTFKVMPYRPQQKITAIYRPSKDNQKLLYASNERVGTVAKLAGPTKAIHDYGSPVQEVVGTRQRPCKIVAEVSPNGSATKSTGVPKPNKLKNKASVSKASAKFSRSTKKPKCIQKQGVSVSTKPTQCKKRNTSRAPLASTSTNPRVSTFQKVKAFEKQ